MPRRQIVRRPNDPTAGTLKGAFTPTAYVADNDRGLGMLVEAGSHSKFWPQTAIFVLEDDAQDGPDHGDGHCSVAEVTRPYARRGARQSPLSWTSSIARSIAPILA